jgi:hypothetical protein
MEAIMEFLMCMDKRKGNYQQLPKIQTLIGLPDIQAVSQYQEVNNQGRRPISLQEKSQIQVSHHQQ